MAIPADALGLASPKPAGKVGGDSPQVRPGPFRPAARDSDSAVGGEWNRTGACRLDGGPRHYPVWDRRIRLGAAEVALAAPESADRHVRVCRGYSGALAGGDDLDRLLSVRRP